MSKMAAALEKRMRFQFECSVIEWKVPSRKDMLAHVVAEGGKKKITLPPGYSDFYTLRFLFHELTHVAAPGELAAFMDWEEDILECVAEANLMKYVIENPRIHEYWIQRLIDVGWVDQLRKRKRAK